MLILRKIRRFLFLNLPTKKIMIEAFIFLGWARILKLFPFSKIAPVLGTHMDETPYYVDKSNSEVLKVISSSIHIMSLYTFWESQCLVKAIAGMKMLERRKIESTLYLGTARDEAGKMVAHAWLRSGLFYVSGSEGIEKFTVVGRFAKKVDLPQEDKK
ncbi:lasso peptide biosynthesis B2 protein [Neobacillus sp. FSL H8-0543]|uniref:lasso peptide biosynthesis B2 protein n=1 Tax=Neobacillus sp. FSL H8-0543 TaxID=2954672 RepID=UPI00315826E6